MAEIIKELLDLCNNGTIKATTATFFSTYDLVNHVLITITLWFYYLALSYAYGFLFLKFIRSVLRIQAILPSWHLISLVGLVVLTTLASYFSLVFNIGWVVHLLLVAGAFIAVIWGRVSLPSFHHPTSVLSSLLLFLAMLVLLENSTHRPGNPDTNIYHAQAVRWIETYPVVTGLGNLHGRLAFNSAWFVTNALFSLSFVGVRSFHLVASVLFLLVVVYCWDGFQKLLQGKYNLSSLLKSFLIPLAFYLQGADVSSPGSDLPASLLLWMVALLWVEDKEQDQPFYPFLIVIFSIFAVTVKFSSVPVLFLAIIVLVEAYLAGEKRRLFATSVCAALILLPFLVRNIILSGYILYPFPAIDFFAVDWKVPLARAEQERLSILSWARFPRQDSAKVLAMSFTDWFPSWLANQTLNRRGILGIALMSIFAVLPGLTIKHLFQQFWLAWLVMYSGTLFWLFTAPDFRFGYGFIIPTLLMPVLSWLVLVLSKTKVVEKIVSGVLIMMMFTFLLFTLIKSTEVRSIPTRLLLPADYDHVPTKVCNLANGTVFCAEAYSACAYNDFPCIPSPRPWVQLRGRTFQDGFRAIP